MYVRRCYRRKDGKRHAYWALVESYRTARGPRQRVVAWLGAMDEQGRLGVKRCAERMSAQQQGGLFRDPQPEWVEVDVQRVRVEHSRKFGGPWLVLELLRRLELDRFLKETLPAGREEIPWSVMATVLVLGRLCDPSSELHLAERFYESSALAELLSVPAEKVNEDRLYRALDALLPHKPALEKHLKEKLGELFDLDYDLLLYDVTSTYFEGQAEKNPQAQRGYSRDHRPDCKQVNIALVVSRCGMPLGYELFAGNRHDSTTLEEIVGHIILCRSAERRVKEQAMHERFERRIEEGLRKIQTSCQKKKQKPVTIATRVGRLLGRNTRAAALFDVKVEADSGGFARLRWFKLEAWREWARLSEGCYLLRSNVTDWSPEDLWRAYIQLTEAEAAFHIHKSDLAIRPVWHQKEHRVQAHILVCFLGYVLWKTLAASCRQAGLGDEPRRVFETLSEIVLVDVVLPTRSGTAIRKRCISQPTEHQKILLQRLGLSLPTALERAAM